nr:SH3 domain-containing protein [uncultured Desulfuromonas sp.]
MTVAEGRVLSRLLLVGMVVLLAACSVPLSSIHPLDLEKIPQNPQAFVDPQHGDQPLLESIEQQRLADTLRSRHYLPWHSPGPLQTTQRPFWAIDWINDHPVYGATLCPLPPDRRRALVALSQQQTYPSRHQPAIMLRHCSARALPTHAPLFNNPQRPGRGFPFDQLQHAALFAGTPVLITHQSSDQAWVFVETAAIYGWVPTTAVAAVTTAQINRIEALPLVGVVEDDHGIFAADKQWRFSGRIGMLLPAVQQSQPTTTLLIAISDENHRAKLCNVTMASSAVAAFPVPLTTANLAKVATLMMGQPYDWGEQFGGRDCSATMRDLFAPFGLWLPRNSSQQAKVGTIIPLSELSPEQREQTILQQGIPFLTLIHLPGHIMLYVGEHQGRAIVLHTLWGLKTTSVLGTEDRWRVAKTVLTTLQPGIEQDGLWLSIGDLRTRIAQMNLPAQSPLCNMSHAVP